MTKNILKTLIIEDHEIVREGLKYLLQRWWNGDLMCVEASSVEETHTLISQDAVYDMVFLDMKMPQVNGYELLEFVVASLPDIPVVIMSVETSAAVIIGAMSRGAKAYIPKSSPQETIFYALEEVLAGRKYFPPGTTPESDTTGNRGGGLPGKNSLTPRQKEIVVKLAEGKTNKEIASLLNMSAATVRSYLTIIFRQLNAKNRTEAVHVARKIGVIDK